jgi:hypothetical protein
MKITTYPMLHIGLMSFYERITTELKRCKFVLREGVSWGRKKKGRKLYDWCARNLGLVAQEDTLSYPSEATVINIDMKRSRFIRRFNLLPLKYKLLLRFLRFLLWLSTIFPPIKRDYILPMLVGKDTKYRDDNDTPLSKLIKHDRDRVIVNNIKKFFIEHGDCDDTTYTGIIYGASHMRAISACLRDIGFRPGSRTWIDVIKIDPYEKKVIDEQKESETEIA